MIPSPSEKTGESWPLC